MATIYFYSPDSRQMDAIKEAAPEGTEVVWVDASQSIDDQAEALKDAVSVIAQPSKFPTELAAKCTNLRLVQVTSAGTDMIDKTALGELGIQVSNNGGGNAVAVAEHTITLMVGTYRKLQIQLQNTKDGNWAGDLRSKWYHQAHEIEGKTIGIIGLGRIGSRVARRLQGWDCEILYHDVIDPDLGQVEGLDLKKVPMDELLQESDIVTLHVPLGRSTRGMFSDREFDLMKPTAVLINACRGPVVDEAALIRAMEQNKIAAAGVDVLEIEPTPVDNPLLQMENVLVTPHLASFTQESAVKSRAFATFNTAKVAQGGEAESVVLPD